MSPTFLKCSTSLIFRTYIGTLQLGIETRDSDVTLPHNVKNKMMSDNCDSMFA